MHATARWPPSSVQKEWNAFFVFVQDQVKIPVTEHQTTTQQPVWRFTGKSFEPLKHRFVNSLRPKMVNQLVIVYSNGFPMFINSSQDVERSDYLLFCFGVLRGFCQ